MKPLCIELFAGRFGWGRGFVAEGWRVVGFDIVNEPWHKPIPDGCSLALQDVLTLHGSQFRDADAIVASPPCQKYSYMGMPWKRAKKMAAEIRQSSARIEELNRLFNSCFRIQMEASQAAGRHIPMIVENVKAAQPWVGPAPYRWGSFYLWGSLEGNILPSPPRRVKVGDPNTHRKGQGPSPHWTEAREFIRGKPGTKVNLSGRDWFAKGLGAVSSQSDARKAASAMIAEIPFELASHIARVFYPRTK